MTIGEEDTKAGALSGDNGEHGLLHILDGMASSDHAARERWTDWPEVAPVVARSLREIADAVAQHAMIRELGLEVTLDTDLLEPFVPFIIVELGMNTTPVDNKCMSTHQHARLVIAPKVSGQVRVTATGYGLTLEHELPRLGESFQLGVYDPIALLERDLVRHLMEQFFQLAKSSHWSSTDRTSG